MICYSILWGRWNDKFPLFVEHFTKTQEDFVLVFGIEPESFLEIKLFIEASKKFSERGCFFNIVENDFILEKHLQNYKYLKSCHIDITKWVHLRRDFVVGEGFPFWIKNYQTGIVWHMKKEMSFNEDISVQWFNNDIAYKMFREYNVMKQDLPYNLDIQNDIIQKRLQVKSSFDASCYSLDCLTSHHLYPIELL